MKKRTVGPVIGAALALGIVMGACTAPAWGPAEREELGEPRLVGAEQRPAAPDGSGTGAPAVRPVMAPPIAAL